MALRKRRTNEHVIADMSLHHLAYLVVKVGFTLEATRTDYGYDGYIVTFDGGGEVENGFVLIQLKATNKIRVHTASSSVLFRTSKKDLDLWSGEPFPVYLVLFDVLAEAAYWLYIQRYLEVNGIVASAIPTKTKDVRIAKTQKVDLVAIQSWQSDKARILAKIAGTSHA